MASAKKSGLWVVIVAAIAVFTVMELLSSREANDVVTAPVVTENVVAESVAAIKPMDAISEWRDEESNEIIPVPEFEVVMEETENILFESDVQLQQSEISPSIDVAVQEDLVEEKLEQEIMNEGADSSQDISTSGSTLQTESESDHQMASTHSIQWHLDAAEKAIKALHLSTPDEDNAYKHYSAVLAEDAQNPAALAGMEKIIDIYLYLYDKAIADEKHNVAAIYLQRAKYIMPNSPKLKNIN